MSITSTRSNTQQNMGGNSVTELSDILNLMVYPNPNTGNFNVLWNNSDKKSYELEIYNMMGDRVYKTTTNSEQAQFNVDLQKGIYFFRLSSIQGSASEKIIIQK